MFLNLLTGVQKQIFQMVSSARAIHVHMDNTSTFEDKSADIPLLKWSFLHPVMLDQHDQPAYYRKKKRRNGEK